MEHLNRLPTATEMRSEGGREGGKEGGEEVMWEGRRRRNVGKRGKGGEISVKTRKWKEKRSRERRRRVKSRRRRKREVKQGVCDGWSECSSAAQLEVQQFNMRSNEQVRLQRVQSDSQSDSTQLY